MKCLALLEFYFSTRILLLKCKDCSVLIGMALIFCLLILSHSVHFIVDRVEYGVFNFGAVLEIEN
uniref:Uncharacterized protein n=1 Tax=Rhizophora mucronata TaxID=61149 RepID=A0A2P2N343_RHIMU